jgi:glutamate-ammonia-ligase adenylyltransferase
MLTLDNLLSASPAKSRSEQKLRHAISCSPFLARLCTKHAGLVQDLLENHQLAYQLADMQNFLAGRSIVDEGSLKKALRALRQAVMARMIVRDLNGLADVAEVMQTTTHLAECAINSALAFLHPALAAVHGQPLDSAGQAQHLIVVGMGKLGGAELNVSSDIDLIFAYAADGETTGASPISHQQFFTRLAKQLIAAIDDITEDGFVFRVDMRLRPFGSEGALVSNLDALEEYYQNNGREWERYAWIKGREVTGGQQVARLLKPFVFRKYLDFGAFASMRDLKQQIQRDVNNKGMQDNIKLGRGGIREIEFVAQVFQLIRGGQDPSLQIKPTLQVLDLLAKKNLLPSHSVAELKEAYVFLRNLEHRLMYVEDAQTQALPNNDEAQARIAKSMNFSNWPDFLLVLNGYRARVQQHFDATFSDASSDTSERANETALWQDGLSEQEAIAVLKKLSYQDAPLSRNRLQAMRHSSRYRQLPESSRLRFDVLMPLAIQISASMPNPDTALLRVSDLLESICRRASYLALLTEHPQAMRLLVKLCSSSPWLSNYLLQHPILLDELLDTRSLYAPPDFVSMRQQLVQRLTELEGDVEQQMDCLRHFKHGHVFRFAVQDINGELSPEVVSDYLSALADLILDVSLPFIWAQIKTRHRQVAKFAVIGYGKLGSRELGYASDLDIIFLYHDDAPEAGEVYARLAQRINNWFNSLTSAGLLYETDLQLRPDGNSGLLVSSVSAFHDYQMNKAWVWEHQAITRARFVAGDQSLAEAFEATRLAVMTMPREPTALKQAVLSMREKMRATQHIAPDLFDLKHSPGGIIDVEFLVQYLLLAHAKEHPALSQNSGNIALLNLLAKLGIVSVFAAEKVVLAYREYRHSQHKMKLQGLQVLQLPLSRVSLHASAVSALWQQVFMNA